MATSTDPADFSSESWMERVVGGETEGELGSAAPDVQPLSPLVQGIAGALWKPVGKWAAMGLPLTLLDNSN